jgi:Domain of unknown function (DUF1996)
MPGSRWQRIAVTVAGAGALALFTAPAMSAPSLSNPGQSIGQFRVSCDYSHRASDDPIVFPGRPGLSHVHEFFGNRTTNAFSTRASLLAGGRTSCTTPGDTSAYWAPMFQSATGQPIAPDRAVVYYTTGYREPASVRPFPPGVQLIAGDAHATKPQGHVGFGCFPGAGSVQSEPPVFCPTGQFFMALNFPDCWDGKPLEPAPQNVSTQRRRRTRRHRKRSRHRHRTRRATKSQAHSQIGGTPVKTRNDRSHFAYSTRGSGASFACPPGFPVPVPTLSWRLIYMSPGAPGGQLNSGSPYTAHGDFFEAWQPGVLEDLVRRCLNAAVDCGIP